MSGQFTVEQPNIATGKMHMLQVSCDLCGGARMFDPDKVGGVNESIDRIIREHLCIKEKVKEVPTKPKMPRPRVFEHEIGSRVQNLGQPEEDDE